MEDDFLFLNQKNTTLRATCDNIYLASSTVNAGNNSVDSLLSLYLIWLHEIVFLTPRFWRQYQVFAGREDDLMSIVSWAANDDRLTALVISVNDLSRNPNNWLSSAALSNRNCSALNFRNQKPRTRTLKWCVPGRNKYGDDICIVIVKVNCKWPKLLTNDNIVDVNKVFENQLFLKCIFYIHFI
jgi:hypothetical protein